MICADRRCIVFAHLNPCQREILSGCRWVWGRLPYVSALHLEDGELLIVISSDSSTTAISDYSKRWEIETLSTNMVSFQRAFFAMDSIIFVLAARRKGKKDLLVPMIFRGSLNVKGFERWLISKYLLLFARPLYFRN